MSELRRIASEDEVVIFGELIQEKYPLCTDSSAGLPSLKSANPQPPVAAYFFESIAQNGHNWPAGLPAALLFLVPVIGKCHWRPTIGPRLLV